MSTAATIESQPCAPFLAARPGPVACVDASCISLVITAHRDDENLHACLASVAQLAPAPREVIVVVEGGCTGVAAAAKRFGLQTLVPKAPGVAVARNAGARMATGSIVAFADSDLILFPDFVSRAARAFVENPDACAAFGSYDAHPVAGSVVSRYRNLLHHFTHQRGSREAQTFWAACGAIRRESFLLVGGFDEAFCRPSVEDIELGYRLRRAGHRIVMDPDWQVRHLKRWRLRELLSTDILRRAMPWTRLLVREGRLDNDLNINMLSRWSASLVCAGLAALLLSPWFPFAAAAGLTGLVTAVFLNRRFYEFLAAKGGWHFALAAVPLHFIYFICAALGCALEIVAGFFTPAGASCSPVPRGSLFPFRSNNLLTSGKSQPVKAD